MYSTTALLALAKPYVHVGNKVFNITLTLTGLDGLMAVIQVRPVEMVGNHGRQEDTPPPTFLENTVAAAWGTQW